jgi:hypothetical protein
MGKPNPPNTINSDRIRKKKLCPCINSGFPTCPGTVEKPALQKAEIA